jgi:hypothetical protein
MRKVKTSHYPTSLHHNRRWGKEHNLNPAISISASLLKTIITDLAPKLSNERVQPMRRMITC